MQTSIIAPNSSEIFSLIPTSAKTSSQEWKILAENNT